MIDWDADFELDETLARRLVTSQFGEEFEAATVVKLGKGWDNVAYVVDDRAVFRFPRRAFAVPFLQRETVWLSRVADKLSMPIPDPKWIGRPTEAFDRPFVGYEFIPGTTLCSANIRRSDRVQIAATVGAFLRELHSLDMGEFGEPPRNDIVDRRDVDRRLDFIQKKVMRLRERSLIRSGEIVELARVVHSRASDDGKSVWAHGDLYVRHVLVDAGRVSGVVDWGDLHYGDRALDLSIAWTGFDFDGRFEFFGEYGEVDDSTRYRAILRAIHYAVTLLDYGTDIQDLALVREGAGALRELIEIEL